MDHLYIHAIVNEAYQSLHTGFDFSQSHLRQLQQILGPVDCLAPQAPDHILCFFALKTGEASLVRVFSKVQRQTNCASRGQMAQCLGWDLKDRDLPEDFPSMLRQEFYTQEEVEAQARQGSEVPLPQREGGAPETVSISPQVRYAILCTLVRRWLRREPALQIAVPEGKDYDSYVLGALEAIYSFLPTALGLEAGAVSYLPDSHVCPDRFYLGFVPAARAGSRTLFLDGSAQGATEALSQGIRQDLDDFLSHLSSLEGQALQDHLRQIYEEIEKHRLTQVTATDYGPLGELQQFLCLEGSLEEKLPRWLAFYRGWRRYPPISRTQVSKAIQNSISVPEFCSLYGRFCETEEPVQCLDRLGTYGPLCRENPALTEGLRQVLLENLSKKGLSPRKIYDMVSRAQILLLPIFPGPVLDRLYGQAMEESIRKLQAMPLVTGRDLETARRQADLLRQQILSSGRKNTEALEQQLRTYEKKLRTLEDRILEQQYLARLEQIRQQPGTTVEEIQKQMDQAGDLLSQVTDHPERPGLSQAEQAIRQFLRERTQAGSGSAARLSQLRRDLDRAPGYFEKLETAAACGDLLADPNEKQRVLGEISDFRPRSLSAFKDQYRRYYGRPMTLAALGELPEPVSGQILRDLGAFRSLTVNLKGRNLPRQKMLERMAVMEKRAQGLRENCPVSVSLGDCRDLDPQWLRQVLELSVQPGDEKLQQVFSALLEEGAYCGRDIPDCLEMIRRCDLSYEDFFCSLLAGKLPECSPRQYDEALRILSEALARQDKDPAQVLKLLAEEIQQEPLAGEALDRFLSSQDPFVFPEELPEKKRSSAPRYVAAALGAVLLLGLVCGFFLGRRLRPRDPIPQEAQITQAAEASTEPVETTEK